MAEKNHFSQNSIIQPVEAKWSLFWDIFTSHPPPPDTTSFHSQQGESVDSGTVVPG